MKLQLYLYLLVICLTYNLTTAQVPTTLNDFFLPGSQPNESGSFNSPTSCNCHDQSNGYIYQGWEGSMMAHALPDPLFRATLAIANQDADSSGDLCLRCHTPTGWLEGRSVPTNGNNLNSSDETSVNCFFCHRMVHPTEADVNPYPTDSIYTADTYPVDSIYLETISGHIPETSANGMYVNDDISNHRRGPYFDTDPKKHTQRYSPFHQHSDLCGTCHDVSNPVYTKNLDGSYSLNTHDTPSPSFDPYTMFPVERTYSEWLNSSYNTPEGIYAPQFGGNKQYVSTCQDCHMRDVTGDGANNNVSRSDLGFHDLTGGNTFIPLVLASMTATVRDSSIARATRMLKLASSMTVNATNDTLIVKVTNETGHKLPSGYPEGRRIWLNLKAFDALDALIYESGNYDSNTGVLAHDSDIKVYEIKPGISKNLSSLTGLPADASFHFVLNDTIYKDNRIPPRGFTNAKFAQIQSPPVNYTYADSQYWDETNYQIQSQTSRIEVSLYYQTTSKEYVEFLRDENNNTDSWGQTMYDLWNTNGKSAPVLMDNASWDAPVLNIKVFLEGAYDLTGDTMHTILYDSELLPLDQPFNTDPWNYSGTESVASIPAGVVDWVLIELRNSTEASSTIASRAAFLKSNGHVTDLDGISPLKIGVSSGNYYIVIHHRNHLSVMSAAAYTINSSSTLYDFTSSLSSAYTSSSAAMKDLGGGVYGMFSGDGNHSGIVTIADRNNAFLLRDGVGYLDEDYNLSGIVTISDVNEAFLNRDASSQVPY